MPQAASPSERSERLERIVRPDGRSLTTYDHYHSAFFVSHCNGCCFKFAKRVTPTHLLIATDTASGSVAINTPTAKEPVTEEGH